MNTQNYYTSKLSLRLKVFKNQPFQDGYTYKIWQRGGKATVSKFAPMGTAPNFTNDIKTIIKTNTTH